MKRLLASFCLLCLAYLPSQAQDKPYKSVQAYIDAFKDIAIREMERSGVPASITLAQGIHESGFGNSALALAANNHFGIKCGNDWKGEKIIRNPEDSINSCYRKYDSAEGSYIDHTELLLKRKHYKFLFDYPRTDYKSWAHGLRKAGYAADPEYPNKLISTVEKYNLNQFDTIAAAYIVFNDDDKPNPTLDDNDETVLNSENNSQRPLRRKPSSFLFTTYRKGFFRQNNASYVVAKKGESALSAADRFGIPYKKFLRFNDLKDGDQLIQYQYLYIQPKKSSYKGDVKYHQINNDETVYEIAQYYGIRLEALLVRNQLKEGEELANGELLMLGEKATAKPRLRPKNHIDALPDSLDENGGVDSVQLNRTNIEIHPDTNTVKRPNKQDLNLNEPIYDPSFKDNPTPPSPPTPKPDTSRTKIPAPPIPSPPTPKPDTNRIKIPAPPTPTPPLPPTPKPDTSRIKIPHPPTPKVDTSRTKIPTPPTPKPPTPPTPSPTAKGKYTVQKGDTLSKVAARYKISIDELKKMNKMKTDNIYVGQVLSVP